jgi:hypothetical protein
MSLNEMSWVGSPNACPKPPVNKTYTQDRIKERIFGHGAA